MNDTQMIIVYGNAKEMREQFEKSIAHLRPEPNKLQKLLYGAERLDEMSDNMIKDIVSNNRGCGKSTAKVLHNIANAIEARGKAVPIEFEYEHKAECQKRFFREYLRHIIDKLELKFVEVNAVQNTIKLDI